jgi:hypothetical protein
MCYVCGTNIKIGKKSAICSHVEYLQQESSPYFFPVIIILKGAALAHISAAVRKAAILLTQ